MKRNLQSRVSLLASVIVFTGSLLISGNASASPCGDAAKACMDKNRQDYEACVARAGPVSRSETDHAAEFQRLRAICYNLKREQDQVCRDFQNKCSKKRRDELNALMED